MAALRPVIARLRGRRRAGGADRCDTVRHSTASALIASGAHIKVVREMLGHSYGITADIYSHVAVDQQREAAARLGEAFRR